MLSDNQILAELKRRNEAGELRADNPLLTGDTTPLGVDVLAEVERTLGHQLPRLLFRIYAEIRNGGFGDTNGFLGLVGGPKNEDGRDALGLWKAFCEPHPDNKYWNWSTNLLPIGHLGRGMYHCVDCSTDKGTLVLFKPDPHQKEGPWDESFFAIFPSLNAYFNIWLSGGDVWETLAPSPK